MSCIPVEVARLGFELSIDWLDSSHIGFVSQEELGSQHCAEILDCSTVQHQPLVPQKVIDLNFLRRQHLDARQIPDVTVEEFDMHSERAVDEKNIQVILAAEPLGDSGFFKFFKPLGLLLDFDPLGFITKSSSSLVGALPVSLVEIVHDSKESRAEFGR